LGGRLRIRGFLEVNVCGTVRRYRMMSNADTWNTVWLDVTDLVPTSSKPSAK
jgi:hypothetical protein